MQNDRQETFDETKKYSFIRSSNFETLSSKIIRNFVHTRNKKFVLFQIQKFANVSQLQIEILFATSIDSLQTFY